MASGDRVALARAIATDPDVLLCDEPTGALDLETGRTVLELLQRLNADGRTVVIVTHNASVAAMAHRVVRVRSGRVDRVERNEHPADASALDW